MKANRLAFLAAVLIPLAGPTWAGTSVGVSVQISEPGVYGRIDIGNFPQPAVVSAQPVIIQQPRVVRAQPVQPVYLWVPPGHQKHWGKHCAAYNACGVPVYFVREEWYQQNVMARHNQKGGHGKGHGKGRGRDD